MRIPLIFSALAPLALLAQDPATVDQFRDQLSRVTPVPLVDSSDLRREALRLPLTADPRTPLSDLQSAQTALIRLADAPTVKLNTPAGFAPILLESRRARVKPVLAPKPEAAKIVPK